MGDLEPRAVAAVDRVPAPEVARDDPGALWCELDGAWQEAFRQAWEALRTGNIAVGACVSRTDGTLVAASRNRVCDTEGPPGEAFGSSVAHAELNTLARLRFRAPRDLVLTSTLQPCLQCHAAIRMAPIAAVRFAGPDPVWDGCGDFTTLAPWVARHDPVPTEGPRTDEIGTFAVLLARSGRGHKTTLEEALRRHGLGDILDLAYRLEETGDLAALKAMNVWPELRTLTLLYEASGDKSCGL
jgi:tRNA(Arg) A34 adenosine deaminase TadA